ncbi:hypothetical protein ACQ3VH_10475 [Bacillus pretiosus]|uniref:hypothetical protein n=2 Tax=Bacillaceae TaxID=186817 RepID=UPI0030F8036A|nr:hypothetical protein [Bacillus cereus]
MKEIMGNKIIDPINTIEAICKTLPTFHFNEEYEQFVLDDESMCPCGKGRKFYDCCLSKYNSVREYYRNIEKLIEGDKKIEQYLRNKRIKNIPGYKLYEKLLKKKNLTFCLAANSETPCSDNKIRYAHTIGKSSILKILNKNQKQLFTFNRYLSYPEDSLETYFVPIKDSEASIVNTFCKAHDQILFKDIENENRYTGEPIQDLQLALNAAALNTYAQILQILFLQKMLNELKEFWVIKELYSDYAFYIKELESSLYYSEKLVRDIEFENFGELYKFSIELKDRVLPFAFCEGCKLDSIFGMNEKFLAFINVFPTENSTWITISTYEESGEEFINLLKQYGNKKEFEKILKVISDIISSQGSNIYFNAEYINELNDHEKAILYYFYAANGARRIAKDINNRYLFDYNYFDKKNLYFNTITKQLSL